MRRIYLDANATTPVVDEVVEAMRPYWGGSFGNPSSIHQEGQQARMATDRAREQVAALLGCREAEVVFTGGGTEGDNHAIRGVLKAGDHLITTAIEHSAVGVTARRMAGRGVKTTFVEPRADGTVAPEAIRAALRPTTRLISVMAANNETGVIQPIEAIGKMAAEAGVLFHVDAVQGAGKLPLDVEAMGCHLLAISAHKMYAPKGVGALYVRRGTAVKPLVSGGSHERRQRAGTLNVPGIVGFGRAAELALATLSDGTLDRVARLRDRLEAELLQLPGTGVNGAGAPRTANTANVWFDGLDGEALVIALDLKGLAVSGGSACHSGATEPSHVLMAMGQNRERALASLRFSLLTNATEADVDYALEVVTGAVKQLREISPAATGTRG